MKPDIPKMKKDLHEMYCRKVGLILTTQVGFICDSTSECRDDICQQAVYKPCRQNIDHSVFISNNSVTFKLCRKKWFLPVFADGANSDQPAF